MGPQHTISDALLASDMKALSLKVSDALDRRLDLAVARRGVTKSVLVREALERYLDS